MTDAHDPLTAEELDAIEASASREAWDGYACIPVPPTVRRLVAMARRAIEMEERLNDLAFERRTAARDPCPPISADSDTKASQ